MFVVGTVLLLVFPVAAWLMLRRSTAWRENPDYLQLTQERRAMLVEAATREQL